MIKNLLIALLPAVALALAGCDDKKGTKPTGPTTQSSAATGGSTSTSLDDPRVSPLRPKGFFTEITGKIGLNEKPERYADGTYLTTEITPGGVLIFDYNNDGLLDFLVVRHPPPGEWPAALYVKAPCKLYRQEKDGKFTEVPNAAGITNDGWGHGGCVGDFDNDGFADVYITNYGRNKLFHNNGDGTFSDWTTKAGLQLDKDYWSSACSFFDYDGDGHLDLYVVTFAKFDPNKRCQATNDPADRDYCGPHTFPGEHDFLYHNNGDGTFTDVTRRAGISSAAARGWGIVCADFTGDGLCDVLVANDEEPNQLWVNQGDGTFADEAAQRGCAKNSLGNVEANMGIAFGDSQNKGSLDLFITHITSETNTYWVGNEKGEFFDKTQQAGMQIVDRPYTGWGTGFIDYDNDGILDIAVANGRVAKGPVRPEAEGGPFWSRFAEQNLFFKGDGKGKFVHVSDKAGDFTRRSEVHRGLGFADLYNRGAIDMICVNLDNTARVYRNDSAPASGNHWVQILPTLAKYKREALGAKVFLTAGGNTRLAVCTRAYSYLASNDPRVHFGLGSQTKVDSVEIHWPSGSPRKEKFNVPGADQSVTLKQGTGTAVK